MKLSRSPRNNLEFFHLIPLVNVLFLTLAFVTLARAFVLQPGLAVTLPGSPFMLSVPRHAQIVSITAGGAPTLYFQDRAVDWEELAARLTRASLQERALIIRADKAVPFEWVARVMNLGLARGYSVSVAAENE